MTHDETAEPTPEQADAVPVDETSTPAVSAPEPQPILVTPPPEPQARGALNLLRRITTRRPAAGPTNLYVTAPPPPAPATSVTEISLRQPFAIGFFATMGALVAVGLWGALTSLQSIIIIIVLVVHRVGLSHGRMAHLTGVPRGVAVPRDDQVLPWSGSPPPRCCGGHRQARCFTRRPCTRQAADNDDSQPRRSTTSSRARGGAVERQPHQHGVERPLGAARSS